MGLNRLGWRRLQQLGYFLAVLGLILGFQGTPPLQAKPTPAAQVTSPAVKQGVTNNGPIAPAIVIPTDIRQHWAASCITALAQQRWITADASGRFYPDEPILWGDYVALLNQISPPAQSGGWANPLERALGIPEAPTVAAHYPSHYYQPDRPLVRAEAIMALAAKVGANYELAANTLINASLADGPQVSEYAREGVAAALAQGMVVNYPEGDRLNPTQRLTRGEAAALVCRAAPNPNLQRWIDSAWVAQAQPTPVAAPSRELRGVWLTNIDSQVLFSTEALQSGVNRLADLNFNTIYPVVWNWGYTLYPSRTAQRELGISHFLYGERRPPRPGEAPEERDMMQEAIDFGHARGMAVVPWFEFGFMAPDNYVLYRRHPDWFTQKLIEPAGPSGRKSLAGTKAWNPPTAVPSTPLPAEVKASDLAREKARIHHWQAQLDGEEPEAAPITDPGIWMEGGVIPRRWMNPFHPQVQKFMLELIDDLVTNYEVDGFQFDDHLGLPVDFGYDPYTINLYRAEHNGRIPPANAQDPEWLAWRANKISDFLEDVYKLVKARRPQAVVSISPNPYPFAYVNYLQDWPEWVNRGIVDEMIIQVYRSDQNRFMWEMNKPSAQGSRRRIPTSIGILSGLRAAPVDMDHITDQMVAVRDRDYAGMAFFFYESLWMPAPRETLDNRTAALQQSFTAQVPRP
ncbi:MAG: hypothetical protein EA342_06445 [Leptolyngbya sp. LCM1.Bin17]|nr:MAG: hypothetical protein EA342_06445 [Leptolyngbya sp. LCM1.Bin17]